MSWLAVKLFFGKLPWLLIGVGLVVAGVLLLAYDKGINHEKRAQAGREAAARAAVKKIDVRADKITADVGQALARTQTDIRYVTKEIIKEVPRYVTVEADAHCVVPAGFLRLHDAAAAGHLPGVARPPGGVDEPSGVPLSVVSAAVADNYGTALGWRAEAEAWRDWYERQAANH